MSKPLDQFSINQSRKNGRANRCKECERAWQRAYYLRRRAAGPNSARSRKTCTSCGQTKPMTRFIVRPTTKDGYSNRCSACESAYVSQYWKTPNGRRIAALSRAKYRARKQGATVENVRYIDVWRRDQGCCYLCSKKIKSMALAHFDHIAPLSRGGNHTVDNLAATHARCNMRKHDKLPEELSWAVNLLPQALSHLAIAGEPLSVC